MRQEYGRALALGGMRWARVWGENHGVGETPGCPSSEVTREMPIKTAGRYCFPSTPLAKVKIILSVGCRSRGDVNDPIVAGIWLVHRDADSLAETPPLSAAINPGDKSPRSLGSHSASHPS